MKQKIKDKFDWAKCQENLSRTDMLDQLYEDVMSVFEEFEKKLLSECSKQDGSLRSDEIRKIMGRKKLHYTGTYAK